MKPASYLHRAKRTLAEDLIHYRRENAELKVSLEKALAQTARYWQALRKLQITKDFQARIGQSGTPPEDSSPPRPATK